jgi:hypothetical protein
METVQVKVQVIAPVAHDKRDDAANDDHEKVHELQTRSTNSQRTNNDAQSEVVKHFRCKLLQIIGPAASGRPHSQAHSFWRTTHVPGNGQDSQMQAHGANPKQNIIQRNKI